MGPGNNPPVKPGNVLIKPCFEKRLQSLCIEYSSIKRLKEDYCRYFARLVAKLLESKYHAKLKDVVTHLTDDDLRGLQDLILRNCENIDDYFGKCFCNASCDLGRRHALTDADVSCEDLKSALVNEANR